MLRAAIDRAGALLRDRETPAGRTANLVRTVLDTAFVLLYVGSTYVVGEPLSNTVRAVELLIGVLFLAEVAVRVLSAADPRQELGDRYMVIDLLATLPVFLLPGPGVGFIYGFQTLRLFRFLRPLLDEREVFGRPLRVRTVRGLELSVTISYIFLVTTGFIHAAEVGVNPGISNYGDAFYYTVIAVATVGFGDIVPVTTAGRWVTVAAVLFGFVVIPWQVTRFRDARAADLTCPRCEEPFAAADRFCRRCGASLREPEEDS